MGEEIMMWALKDLKSKNIKETICRLEAEEQQQTWELAQIRGENIAEHYLGGQNSYYGKREIRKDK